MKAMEEIHGKKDIPKKKRGGDGALSVLASDDRGVGEERVEPSGILPPPTGKRSGLSLVAWGIEETSGTRRGGFFFGVAEGKGLENERFAVHPRGDQARRW
jgi:hypothetical protein